jgi:uncharacterized protein YdcH (DUF465 family)
VTFTDIVADVRFLTGTDSSSYAIADITRNANVALNDATAAIFAADGRWQFDDSNQTDQPVATTALVADQQGYAVAVSHLRIERVEVKDENGDWTKLAPIDQADVFDRSLTDFLGDSGAPAYYDVVGQVVNLYPAPDYSQAASLKLWFQRGPSEFVVADTTKTPGFASTFHRVIPLSAAYDYAVASGNPAAPRLREERDRLMGEMRDFYSMRHPDDRPRLSTRGRYARFN